jgi:hypothetical protein
MAKTRLTETSRQRVLDFMIESLDAKMAKHPVFKLRDRVIAEANKIIRKKYPEDEMLVLRKYKLTRLDNCLRFSVTETGEFFGVTFKSISKKERTDSYGFQAKDVADIPSRGGCNDNTVYPVNSKFRALVHDYTTAFDGYMKHLTDKINNYKAFMAASKTIEDVEEVVVLPSDLRTAITGNNSALIAINDETIANIRADFGGK